MESSLKSETIGRDIYLTPKVTHTETLIWLHGLGDSAEGFYPVFVNSKISPCPPTTRVVLLTAPARKVTINMGMICNSWYDIRAFRFDEASFESSISVKEADESIQRVHDVIEQEAKLLKGDYSRIVVGGFSQGCSISLSAALTFKKTLGGIIVFSGFLFPNVVETKENENTSILIGHGELDPLIPWSLAQISYKKLNEEKHKIEKCIDPVLDHGLSQKSLEAFKSFWSKIFKKN